MITKEELNELITQYKSEMLINDPLVQALEDFRDMREGLEKAVWEIKAEMLIGETNKELYTDDVDKRFVDGADYAGHFIMRILNRHLPFLKENQ